MDYPLLGVYAHYKSSPEKPMLYQLLGFARHTEREGEVLALYVPLYLDAGLTGLRVQARPLDMFMETVEVAGKACPRFRFLGPELRPEHFA